MEGRANLLIDWRSDPEGDIAYWHQVAFIDHNSRRYRKGFSGDVGLYLHNEQGGVSWQCGIPIRLSALARSRFMRFIAAVANNLVMTHGGSRLHIKAGVRDYNEITAELSKRYHQALDIMTKWYPNGQPYIIASDETSRPDRGPKQESRISSSVQQSSPGGLFLGIDIGNSRTKIVVLCDNNTTYMDEIPSQIKEDILLGPYKCFDRIAEIVKRLTAHYIPTKAKFTAVGIAWFGDVLKEIPLTQAADLVPWSASMWAQEIRGIKDRMQAKFGCPLSFYGDSESLAKYLGIWRGLPQTYLLILGTSTGGAYFLPDGSYQNGVNLASRIIIDLNDDAPRHTSTGSLGVLQQYSASYGIERAFGFFNSSIPHDNSHISRDGAYLSSLLISSEVAVVEYAKRCVDVLAYWLIPAVVDLRTHYYFDQLVFSGGNVRSPLGLALVESFQRQWDECGWGTLKVCLLSDKTGCPTSYEVAIAAAKLAAFRFADGA